MYSHVQSVFVGKEPIGINFLFKILAIMCIIAYL